MDRGADINAKAANSWTLLHLAVGLNKGLRVIELLLDRGANINAKAEYLETPLHFAAMYSQDLSVIELLLNRGADITARGKIRRTAYDLVKGNKVLARTRARKLLSK